MWTILKTLTGAMMTETTFPDAWRSRLVAGQLGVVLVNASHPLEIYVGANSSGHPLLQIRSKVKPPLPELSELVLVSRHEADGAWILSLALQDLRFTEIFLRLTSHLVTASQSEPNETEAWRTVAKVLDAWKRLLRARPPGLLSLEELRGLVGELWILLNRFTTIMTPADALAGWLGPMGAPQDFWYEASGYHETKSIGPSAPSIRISSAEQLDQPDMELLVLHVPQAGETDSGATNLIQLVERAENTLSAAGAAAVDLHLRLKRLGVEIEMPYYADTWFTFTTLETFKIVPAFPAIRASELPAGVERVRYNLDRRAVASFLVSTEHL
ncbi:PD-(D/E)XK motif protein [Actinoplanes sp. NPDC051633]|uniref:PD-(D/E)XK motif protein n=1 Tax=Actinoplanes sp. NPDC051633 TaxID=3155670 RepID=UPI00341595CC